MEVSINFGFRNPTRLIFEAGVLSRLGEAASAYGNKGLLVTGGCSVKHNGVFEQAAASQNVLGISLVKCLGVKPKSCITTVLPGDEITRTRGGGMVIALGGGSTTGASRIIL